MIPLSGWVAPFGHPRIKACSRLPMAFRSVPRPSSPPGAKASTECPSLAQPPTCTETIHDRTAPDTGRSNTTLVPSSSTAHLTANPRSSTRGQASARVRPTRITVRPDAHQPLHTAKEHIPDHARDAGANAPRNPTRDPITNPLRDDRPAPPPLVEADGIEPTTPCLQSRCSPS